MWRAGSGSVGFRDALVASMRLLVQLGVTSMRARLWETRWSIVKGWLLTVTLPSEVAFTVFLWRKGMYAAAAFACVLSVRDTVAYLHAKRPHDSAHGKQ